MRIAWWAGVFLVLHVPAVGSADAVSVGVDIASLVAAPPAPRTVAVSATNPTAGTDCTLEGVAGCTGRVVASGGNRHITLTAGCISELIPDMTDAAARANAAQLWRNERIVLACGEHSVTVTWPAESTDLHRTATSVTVGAAGSAVPLAEGATVVAYDHGMGIWAPLQSPQPAAFDGRPVVFHRSSETAAWQLATVHAPVTQPVVQPTGRGGVDGGQADPTVVMCGAPDAERFCARELAGVRQGACFVETRRDDLQLIEISPEDHVMRANTSFTVVACIESDHTLRGTMSGTVGLTDPAIDVQAQDPTTAAAGGTTTYRRVRLSFAPRQPGAGIDLVLKLRDANNTQRDEVETEIIVEQTYAGALRLGVGIPLFAVDRAYTAEAVPGSSQLEIVGTGSDADVELVVTFAGFLEALYGGRSYTRPGVSFLEHWGVFVAAGVLSSSQRGVQFLTSIYLGVELEPIRSLSFGFGFVLRRVHRLIEGYSVGDAVVEGTTLSAETWEPGVGFVIGVSPEFLQFAGALGGG